jgi:hypothetical protein
VSWSSRRQRFAVYLLVALCALAVRFGFWSQIRGTPLDEWHKWKESDMATYVEQARRLAAGDWLAREPYHPYHDWQKSAASEEDWLRWQGPTSFHQAPLYSYALAALSRIRADYLSLVKALQLLLGAGTCVLIAHLAGRMGGAAAAAIAGTIAALYGPQYYLEIQPLREAAAVFGYLGIVLLTIRHAALPREAPWRQQARSAGVLGLLLGGFALFHETAPVIAAVAACVVALHAVRSTAARPALALAAFAAGCAVGYAPLVARNAAIGVPLFAGSSRLGVNLATVNMSTALDGGATLAPPGPQLKEIMDAAGGSTLGIAREIWRGYEGDRGRLFTNWAHRLRLMWASVELPDNTSIEFYRRHSPILRVSLSFRWIFPAALAVWVVFFAEGLWSRRAEASSFRLRAWFGEQAAAHAVLLGFTLLLAVALSVNPPQARYRLFLVPAFTIYTSLALVGAARFASARRLAPTAALVGATAGLAMFHAWVSWPRLHAEDRYSDYTVAASLYRKRGNEAAAEEYLRRHVITPASDLARAQ